jgi:hypothetical protein
VGPLVCEIEEKDVEAEPEHGSDEDDVDDLKTRSTAVVIVRNWASSDLGT